MRALVVGYTLLTTSELGRFLTDEFGAEVEVISDCASAGNRLSSSDFDIITLDCQLPDSDILNFLEEIRSAENPPPVIMVTGRGGEQVAAREIPRADEEPFTNEEHELIEGLSRQLSTTNEYRQAMEELLVMNGMLDRYAHTVSHDLKGPLSAINLAVTVLDGQLSQQQETDVTVRCSELLKVIDSSVKKAIRMVNDLLPKSPPTPPS